MAASTTAVGGGSGGIPAAHLIEGVTYFEKSRSRFPNAILVIEKSNSTSTVVFAVNLDADGALDRKKPIDVFWIMYKENQDASTAKIEQLNYIESTIGYGVKIDSMEEDGSGCSFHCMAFASMILTVSKGGPNGEWIAKANIDAAAPKEPHISTGGEQHIIQRIRMHLKGIFGGKLDYADIFGMHHTTNTPVHEAVRVSK